MTTVLGDSSGSKKFKSDRNLNLIRRNRYKFLIMQSHISVSSKKDRLNLKLKTTFIWVRLQSCPEGWRSKLNVSWNWKRNTWLKRKTVRQVISFRMLKVGFSSSCRIGPHLMTWTYSNPFCPAAVGLAYPTIVIFRLKIKCGEAYRHIRAYEINCYDKSWGSL